MNNLRMVWSKLLNKIHNKSKQSLFKESQRINYYALEGHKDIDGWLSDNSLSLIYYLDKIQNVNKISGNIAEIGVYKGRFFIALCLLLMEGEKALAIDVFADQQFNLDESGEGDLDVFTANLLDKLGDIKNIEILQSDSKLVTRKQLLGILGSKVRMFSVDGCHTAEHTESDLLLAAQSLAPGGFIILDDFGNQNWPGVPEGVQGFLQKNKSFVPVAVAYNKLYLADKGYHFRYHDYLKKIVEGQTDHLEYRDVFGHRTLNILMPPPEKIFATSFLQFIDFSSSVNSEKHLVRGWFPPEPWGVWSDGLQSAVVKIEPNFHNVSGVLMIVSFHVFVAEEYNERAVGIFINSRKIESVSYRFGSQDYLNWKFVMPSELISESDDLTISFQLQEAKSPYELGLSADTRKLGVGLRSVRFFQND